MLTVASIAPSLALSPPTDKTPSPDALPNGNHSYLSNKAENGNAAPSDSESDLSDLADRGNMLSSSPLKSPNIEDTHHIYQRSSETLDHESNDDDDAMGSEDDGDYEMENAVTRHHVEQSDHSDSSQSTRSRKRKAPEDGNVEFAMYDDPELYGLRRSGRARPSRQIVESSDDSDPDVVSSRRKRQKPTPSQKSSKRPTPNLRSPSESDDGTDTYGGARARLSKNQRRRLLQQSNLAPAHAEVRFSTRRAAKISSYNEDDDDEDGSENLTPAYYAEGVEDNTPAIEAILDHRLREDVEAKYPDLTKEHFEFYVKWQGLAHYHATWETNETLTIARSYRRLENYCRKTLAEDLRIAYDPDVAPEEKEKWNLDRERDIGALDDYKKVERVIDSRTGEGGPEYFVKWKGLVYEYCTWETGTLVSEHAQFAIDRYLDRAHKALVSNKIESNQQSRRPFERFHVQPDYVKNGILRDFQVTGLNYLAYNWCRGNNVILADEMGLGKTVQTVAFMSWLMHDRGQQGPFIVIAPLSTIPSWAETLDHWAPDINYVVYQGKEASRSLIRDYELLVNGDVKQAKFNLLVTTYEFVLRDAHFLNQIKWQFLAVDEAHRLKNRESQLYDALLEFKAPCRLLITGTPMQNTLGELASLMDFLMPGQVDIDANMDLQSPAAAQKVEELVTAIKPYMLRRTKQKVESDLPPKSEKIIRVELSDVQLEYYKNILTKNYAALNQGAKGPKQSLLNIMMELKKASNHPFMFPNAEERILSGSNRPEDYLRALITSSGKMMLLDQLLTKLRKDSHRVLIFSQMVKMLDILQDYLGRRGYQYQRLDGTIGASARRMSIDHFNAPGSQDFCFLLSTRAGGLGINLMTADTVILFDSDWNPQADLQAMARAHRIGQQKPVSIYRLVSKETVEEEILERARNKLMLEFITIQRGVTDKEAKELGNRMARAGRGVDEPSSSEDISLILKRRGQRMFEQSGNQKKLEELDIDSVLANAEEHQTEQPAGIEADGGEEFLKSFDYVDVQVDLTWDDIIPKDQLEEIKADEKKKADEKYLADVIEQNAPRKRKAALDEREERNAKRQQRAREIEDVSDEGPGLDPKRPLNEKEHRNLIRAYLRYGSIHDRTEELIKEARLAGRDFDLLKDTLQIVIDRAKVLIKDNDDRIAALEQQANRVLTKKDKKAVLFDYQGVKRLNAVTLVERASEMQMLKTLVNDMPEPLNFRIQGATKGASYSCPWNAQDDGRLMVGQAKYGFGAWTEIRDDPSLELRDKLFLEEQRVEVKEERKMREDKNARSPGAVHLVRRTDYLLSVLKDALSGGANPETRKAVENHHRNNKKHQAMRRQGRGASVSASPAPPSNRNPHRQTEKHRRSQGHGHRDSVERRTSHGGQTPRPDVREHHEEKKKHRRSEEHSHHRHKSSDKSNGSISNDQMGYLKLVFKPVKESLLAVQKATKEEVPDKVQRAKQIRLGFRKLGQFIKETLADEGMSDADGRSSLERGLWDYVCLHWPNPDVNSKQLKSMYERLAAAENTEPVAASPTSGANGQPKSQAGDSTKPVSRPAAST